MSSYNSLVSQNFGRLMLHHNNATSHTIASAPNYLKENVIKILEHTQYLLYLAMFYS